MIAEDRALTSAEILLDIFTNEEAKMSPEAAKGILSMRFTDKQRARMLDLADRSSAGTLSPAERQEMEGYANAGTFLSLLHAKARLAMRNQGDPSE